MYTAAGGGGGGWVKCYESVMQKSSFLCAGPSADRWENLLRSISLHPGVCLYVLGKCMRTNEQTNERDKKNQLYALVYLCVNSSCNDLH